MKDCDSGGQRGRGGLGARGLRWGEVEEEEPKERGVEVKLGVVAV